MKNNLSMIRAREICSIQLYQISMEPIKEDLELEMEVLIQE